MTNQNTSRDPSSTAVNQDTSPSTARKLSEQFDPTRIVAEIEKLRQNLLDIGTRNRLISAPLRSSRANVLEIIDEKADQVFSRIWREGSAFSFVANGTPQPPPTAAEEEAEADEGTVPVYVPFEDSPDDGTAARHKDTNLQTRLQAEALQKRLLTLQHDSALFEEEQGANILFLAVGFLKWFEADSSDIERFAPLLLVPVKLERDRVRSRFRLKKREDDIETNLSLQAKLKQDFGIVLPELPDNEDWLASDYHQSVEAAVSTKKRWSVERNAMLLGFFSFSKFLLYRDLDVAEWPKDLKLDRNDLINGLLLDGFDDSPLPLAEEEKLDRILSPAELGHVLDADSSQAAVIKMASDGRNMVVQGPPGTGKSQTISNIVAAAARQGKTILFVAEKMAALEVVYDRLRASGLDALCLELHSQKANKRAVYEELKRTLELGRVADAARDIAAETKIARDRLNDLSQLLHSPVAGTGETPFQTIASLVRYRDEGVEPPEFSLDIDRFGGLEKSKAAAAALQVLARSTETAGPSAAHPWRGTAKRLNPIDLQRLGPQLKGLLSSCEALDATAKKASALLSMALDGEGPVHRLLFTWLNHFSTMPESVRRLIGQDPFRLDPNSCQGYLAAVREAAQAYGEAKRHTSEAGISQDWSVIRQTIASRGQSPLRVLSGEYRRSIAALNSTSIAAQARTYEERLNRLDAVIAYQKAGRHLSEIDMQGRAAFGAAWQGQETDTHALDAALDWYLSARKLPGAAAHLDRAIAMSTAPEAAAETLAGLRERTAAFETKWQGVCSALDLDLNLAFGESEPTSEMVAARAGEWLADLDRAGEWFALKAAENECKNLGLEIIVEKLSHGTLRHDRAVDVYKFARAEAAWRRMCADVPELGLMQGDERTALVQQFCELERQLFVATSREIAAKHTASIPAGAQGQMGFVRGQIGRRRGHASIRTLMASAGEAVQKIKPIFLMSPISVAQFLPPGSARFDLILIDEASQVRPEDAIGVVARGNSIVVVGDNKQLPPTSFFDRTIGTITADADEGEEKAPATVAAGAMESILSLCQARGLPGRTLQWHYRSRHPSLIQVSNEAFYEHKLKFPPSPERAGRDGLLFRRVDGIYDRGQTRTNRIEAKIVAKAVIAHVRECPHLSLGVATLSVPQRDAIRAELELLRAQHADLEHFFDRAKTEPFFVKNLENVQGDERDVIFVSICYARDNDGYMAQTFGPVSAEGGERRLNVLFTRAKRRCEIFSSITHADIELRGENAPVGRRVLHTYLKFAETGQTDTPTLSGLEPDSDFEIAVANRIRSAGYDVDFQVGSAGFRVDIGVRDPNFSNSYILGVECDGAAYHSALWARERDRLRQQVLESKGWRLHRVWSTDWFNRPDSEFRKLLLAIDRAKATHAADVEAEREAIETRIEIEREKTSSGQKISFEYEEAELPPLAGYDESHLVPPGLMANYVTEVVRIEQPVHTDEIAKRVARAWGAQRTGARIRASVEAGLKLARSSGKIKGGPFWSLPASEVRVRNRSGVASASLRSPDYLPPAEINEAIRQAIARSVALTFDELARDVADALGFGATTALLKSTISVQVKALGRAGVISEIDGILRLRPTV